MEALLADDPSAFFTIPPRGRRHAAALGGRSFTEQACYERLLQLCITLLGWRASAFGSRTVGNLSSQKRLSVAWSLRRETHSPVCPEIS